MFCLYLVSGIFAVGKTKQKKKTKKVLGEFIETRLNNDYLSQFKLCPRFEHHII